MNGRPAGAVRISGNAQYGGFLLPSDCRVEVMGNDGEWILVPFGGIAVHVENGHAVSATITVEPKEIAVTNMMVRRVLMARWATRWQRIVAWARGL